MSVIPVAFKIFCILLSHLLFLFFNYFLSFLNPCHFINLFFFRHLSRLLVYLPHHFLSFLCALGFKIFYVFIFICCQYCSILSSLNPLPFNMLLLCLLSSSLLSLFAVLSCLCCTPWLFQFSFDAYFCPAPRLLILSCLSCTPSL